jgi:hypothetical protein
LADKVNLTAQFRRFDDHWSPRIVATLNDYDVKVVKVQGEFVWHQHDETDELFLVTAGQSRMALAAGRCRRSEHPLSPPVRRKPRLPTSCKAGGFAAVGLEPAPVARAVLGTWLDASGGGPPPTTCTR